jgi:hypothetical protein
MWKLLVVSDKSENSVTFKIAKKLFDVPPYGTVYFQNSNIAFDFIKHEAPQFLFLDLSKEHEGEDLQHVMTSLGDTAKLKVTVFHLSAIKATFLKIFPLDFIDFIISIFIWRSEPGLSGKGKTAR